MIPKIKKIFRIFFRLLNFNIVFHILKQLFIRLQSLWYTKLIASSGLFDSEWYLKNNPDVVTSGINPVTHYVRFGAAEKREPSPFFNTDWYIRQTQDVNINPLLHYLQQGASEGYEPNPLIDTKLFIIQNPNLNLSSMTPLAHYIRAVTKCNYTDDYKNLSYLLKQQNQKHTTPVPVKLIQIDNADIHKQLKALKLLSIEKPIVSIIIPIFNNLKLTLECLLSIITYTNKVPYEVIIIDDGSTETVMELLSDVQGLKYLRNETNLGYLRTCNRAAKEAKGEYIVFLNNDVQVTPHWLENLLSVFHQYKNVGAVGPKILYPNGVLQEAGCLIGFNGIPALIGDGDDPDKTCYNFIREVDYCSGACLIIKTEKLHELNGFDERYIPAYFEDVDLSLRLREQGLRIIYNPNAVIIHHLSATSNTIDKDYKIQCVIRNQQTFVDKWQQQIEELNKIRLITFYDLEAEGTLDQQAELAKKYGIYGFCFYYNLSDKKPFIKFPLKQALEKNKSNIPFCLCITSANRYKFKSKDYLTRLVDNPEAIHDIVHYMKNNNYIRINNRPLLLIDANNLILNKDLVELWRNLCHLENVGEIYLAVVATLKQFPQLEIFKNCNMDALVEYPSLNLLTDSVSPEKLLKKNYATLVKDYQQLTLESRTVNTSALVRFRTAVLSWSNVFKRRFNNSEILNSTPGAYQAWLEAIVDETRKLNFGDERIVFIDSWNMGSKKPRLQPNSEYRHIFLEVTREVLDKKMLTLN